MSLQNDNNNFNGMEHKSHISNALNEIFQKKKNLVQQYNTLMQFKIIIGKWKKIVIKIFAFWIFQWKLCK